MSDDYDSPFLVELETLHRYRAWAEHIERLARQLDRADFHLSDEERSALDLTLHRGRAAELWRELLSEIEDVAETYREKVRDLEHLIYDQDLREPGTMNVTHPPEPTRWPGQRIPP